MSGQELHGSCRGGVSLGRQQRRAEILALEVTKAELWVLHQGVDALVVLLLAPVGEVVTVTTAEVPAAWRKVKLEYSPPARLPIDEQGMNEPVSDSHR